MSRIKGPGIFLAQFLRDEEPYNNLVNISKWAADSVIKAFRFQRGIGELSTLTKPLNPKTIVTT